MSVRCSRHIIDKAINALYCKGKKHLYSRMSKEMGFTDISTMQPFKLIMICDRYYLSDHKYYIIVPKKSPIHLFCGVFNGNHHFNSIPKHHQVA